MQPYPHGDQGLPRLPGQVVDVKGWHVSLRNNCGDSNPQTDGSESEHASVKAAVRLPVAQWMVQRAPSCRPR